MAILVRLKSLSRSFTTLSPAPLRICVVGSGPAGFYTAEKLLKAHEGVEVDIIDRLPTPFGLVRSGVAPDHPETKVVLSYGAESDRSLGIHGEELSGIHAAREFVWWYNGHPDCRNLAPDLKSSDTAVILGQGNVALDVARVLLRTTTELARTDIASHALAALEGSSIRRVFLVGRRGPVQAAWTAKELREILGINLDIRIQQADLVTTPADEIEMKSSRIRKRVYELLSRAANPGTSSLSNQRELHFVFFHRPEKFLDSEDKSGHLAGVRLEKTILKGNQRELHFVFFHRPEKFLDSEDKSGHLAGVRLEKTILKGDEQAKQVAVGTGVYEDISIALKSIGYKSLAIDGLPFDNHKGIVPNIGGRVLGNVLQDESKCATGLYVCGWLKRGPTGIIGTNLYCAEETLACISDDIHKGVLSSDSSKPGGQGLLQLLNSRRIRVVPFCGWERIDAEERRRGNLEGKPRQKLTTWEELLEVGCG
ncbi:NADPH:adrenodoxin oxidoreductase, mitochondrial-like [Dorcoceras hygrometricum]|uniref:NADPH:adrenodoxin oxidoreductase, mitochondrial n=1 Tax=Dorcoceras hygrometricum TaxID=472368 RepID=A0A2Z7CGV9_9LAMI|nr:NADPH:adrenodoxin oxidoreductase, mitochondrial-like [Dorcoceras hygrometricum]